MNEHNVGDLARRETERHLLAAVDESENSRRAIMYLADFFCGRQDVIITLLSIIPEPSEDYFATEEERRAWLTEKRELMAKKLAEYREILCGAGFGEAQIAVRLTVRPCVSIGDEIIAEQKRLRCDIVVVGRRGISHSEEFIFGSTSSRVLHQARNCAVMVVE